VVADIGGSGKEARRRVLHASIDRDQEEQQERDQYISVQIFYRA